MPAAVLRGGVVAAKLDGAAMQLVHDSPAATADLV